MSNLNYSAFAGRTPGAKNKPKPIVGPQKADKVGQAAYKHHDYNGPTRSFKTEKGHTVTLEKGHHFGIRESSHKPGEYRMIHPHTGRNVVFKLSGNMATRLKKDSTMRKNAGRPAGVTNKPKFENASNPKQQAAAQNHYNKLRAKGHSHPQAMKKVHEKYNMS